MNVRTISICLMTLCWFACSDPGDGTTGSESHWLPCQKTDDCDSDYICARNQCRSPDELPEDWVGECEPSREVCVEVVGSAPMNDPEYETLDWDYGFDPERPAGAGTCTIGDHDWFRLFGEMEYDEAGRLVRSNGQLREYDDHGFVLSAISPSRETLYERDAVGRLLVKTETNVEEGTTRGRRYSYDEFGRISRVVSFQDDEDTYDQAVEWSEDGLSHTDYNAVCQEDGATITRDSSGRVKRRDWPDCPAFGSPYSEYQYDEQGRFLNFYPIDRETGEHGPSRSQAFYEGARLAAVEEDGGWADNEGVGSARSAIEWEDGWMRRITVTRMYTGNVIDVVELEGECWFTLDQVRFATPHGTIIGDAGL